MNESISARLAGQVAVITGAGSGLGRSHALTLAKAGARVVVNDIGLDERDRARAELVAEEIRAASGDAVADTHSVSTADGGEGVVQNALDVYGRVDILVANAGILLDSAFGAMSAELWQRVIDVNLNGTFNVAQPAWRAMTKQGYGRVVLTSSASGIFGNRGHANYGASKMGVLGLAKMLAIEGVACNINVNAIAPLALTPLSADTSGSRTSASSVLGGLFKRMNAADVSPLVLWLCHPDCEVTGEAFSVGGGRIARIFVAESDGWVGGPAPTVESIRDNWSAICSPERFHTPASMSDELALYAAALPEPRTDGPADRPATAGQGGRSRA